MKANHDILLNGLNTVSNRTLKSNYLISDKLSRLKTNRIHSSELITRKGFNYSQNKISLTRTSKSIQNKQKIVFKRPALPIKVDKCSKEFDEFYVEDCIIIQKLTPSKSIKNSRQSLFSRLHHRKTLMESSLTNNIEIQTSYFEQPNNLNTILV